MFTFCCSLCFLQFLLTIEMRYLNKLHTFWPNNYYLKTHVVCQNYYRKIGMSCLKKPDPKDNEIT